VRSEEEEAWACCLVVVESWRTDRDGWEREEETLGRQRRLRELGLVSGRQGPLGRRSRAEVEVDAAA
jgi:hypothetical protein